MDCPMEGDRGDVKENGAAEANCPRLESSTEKIISENAENVCDPLLSQPDEANLTPVEFFVVHNKNKHKVNFFLEKTVSDLKKHLQNILGVPQHLQKIMFKGLAKDDQSLKDIGVTKDAKVMVVGSKLTDVLAVSTPSNQDTAEEKSSSVSTSEPFCRQKIHRKVLDKGVPDDAMPGILNIKEPLPPYPISGMLNKSGGKVRLTFKLEVDQVWIGTKERTDKLGMSSIKNVISEPIEGHEEYHIMAVQLGPTEASRYWIYWVPAQYVDSIRDTILGTVSL
nr:PREDICTED: ubiquitin domain-containing protein UBFD1-like isoform X1 [Bemisia tabaci]